MGELTDVKVLKMAKQLHIVSSQSSIVISARMKANLATVCRIEANTPIEETPFHVVIIGWWNIESKCGGA
jgi:hypothetical protein